MSFKFEDLVKLVEEISTDYQKSDRIRKHASKRMSTKGKVNKDGAPYSKNPPTARAKSAPPGFGFTMEELYKLIDEALEEVGPSSTSAADHDPAHGGHPAPEGAEEPDEEERGEEGEETGAPGILPDPAQDKVLATFIEFAKSMEYETAQVKGKPTNAKDPTKDTALVVTNLGQRFDRDKIAREFAEQFKGDIDFADNSDIVKRSQDGTRHLNGIRMNGVSGQPFKMGPLKIVFARGAVKGKGVTNRGDVAEGIVAAALAARFKNPVDEMITKKEVVEVLARLDQQEPSKRKNSIVKTLMFDKHETATEGVFDQVKMVVGLGAAAFDELMDEG